MAAASATPAQSLDNAGLPPSKIRATMERWTRRNQYALLHVSSFMDFESHPHYFLIYVAANLITYFSVAYSQRSAGSLFFMGLLAFSLVNRQFLRLQRKRQDAKQLLT